MERAVCTKTLGLLGPFLDGELDAASIVEVDEHLAACSGCRERITFQRALKNSVKRATAQKAPEALRARIQAAFAAERAKQEAEREAEVHLAEVVASTPLALSASTAMVAPSRSELAAVHALSPRRRFLQRAGNLARTWVPVSAAAAALMFAYSTRRTHSNEARLIPRGVLGDLVAEHSHPLPPERTDPSDVRALERYVGVPVNLPFSNAKRKARLVGGRIMPLQSERAAMLQYEVDRGGATPQRVSVFIYDPSRIHVDGEQMNAVGASRVGRQNGYSVAVTQHNGVGYAFASDLDPEMTAELANNVE